MTTTSSDLGDSIVQHSRAARLGSDSAEAWQERVEALLRSEADLGGVVHVENVRPVDSGSGNSSGTLLFDAVIDGGKRIAAVLRFAPDKPLFHVYDLANQVGLQRGLSRTDVPVPRQICADFEGRFLGVPGYVMARVPGEGAAVAWAVRGVIAEADPAQRRRMMIDCIGMLARIHAVDHAALGMEPFLQRAKGDAPIAREINWFWDALQWHGAQDVIARLSPVRDWLIANEPVIDRPVLCHGDSNLTNYLFQGDKVVGVLDWEMAFLGAPGCDLTYLIMSMSSMFESFPEGVPSVAEIYAEYERVSGTKLENLPYHELFAYYRTEIILELAKPHFPPEFMDQFSAYSGSMTSKLVARAKALGITSG